MRISSSLQCVPAARSPQPNTTAEVPRCPTVQPREAMSAGLCSVHEQESFQLKFPPAFHAMLVSWIL